MNKMSGEMPIQEHLSCHSREVAALWASFAGKEMGAGRCQKIFFSGIAPGVGTTTAACCSALGLAEHLLAPTLLVEVRAGQPRLEQICGLPLGPGLSELLAGQTPLEEACRASGVNKLTILGAGRSEPAGRQGSSLAGIQEVFESLTRDYRFVLIDAPPLLVFPVSRLLLRHVDKAVIVVRAGRSRRSETRAVIDALGQWGIEPVGMVLNRYRREAPPWLIPSKWS